MVRGRVIYKVGGVWGRFFCHSLLACGHLQLWSNGRVEGERGMEFVLDHTVSFVSY